MIEDGSKYPLLTLYVDDKASDILSEEEAIKTYHEL